MKYLNSLPRLSIIAFLISQSFLSLSAHAAGYQINEISPSLQGDATAGAAAAKNDVSSLFINPATLSTLLQNQAYVGASEIFPHVRMSNASATHTVVTPGIPPVPFTATVLGVNSQSRVSKPVFVPDGYVGWRLNDQLVVGLAFIAPWGLTTKYRSDSVVRFGAVYSSVFTVNITPSIAYAINNQWSVGAGFQAQYISATFSNFNGAYTGDPAIDALIAANSPTYLRGSSWGYGYTAGVLFKPDLCTRIGLGYRSQVAEQISGHGQQITGPGPTVRAPSRDFPFNAQTYVRAGIKTPAVLTLSAARDIYDWTIKATAQVNFWNTFNQLSIYMPGAFVTNSTILTKWKNTFFGALGADYRFKCDWEVRGGVAYDQTPTQDTYRDPRIPDASRVWLTLGGTYKPTKHWSFDGAYAHIFIANKNVNVTQPNGTNALSGATPLEVNHIQANFHSSVDIVALGLRYSF